MPTEKETLETPDCGCPCRYRYAMQSANKVLQDEMTEIARICDNAPEQRYDDTFSLKIARQHNAALNEIRRIAGQFL